MKNIRILFVLLFLCSGLFAQKTNPNYDKDLAEKYGGDDYGMRPFVLAILKSGENTSNKNSEEAFRGHMDNINRLVEEGKLIVAGPLSKNENNYRGIFILNVKSIAEAEELLKTDPAISERFLDFDLYRWHGSAALSAYLEDSDKIWKFNP